LVEVDDLQGFSLNMEVIKDIFQHAKPLGHNEQPENSNLGFGFLYYGVVRAVRPNHVLVIGSGFGFSVVCLALGLKDNHKGRLTFVDPSFDVLKHGPWKTFGGRGTWDKPDEVAERFKRFGVDGFITHHKLTSEAFFTGFKDNGLPKIDIAFVDGNHSYKNVKYDFLETLQHTRRNSYIFIHDTNIYIREMVRNAGVKRWLKFIRQEKARFEVLDFPFSSGVAIIRILQDDAWKYLAAEH
jgi:hypothetical protein